MWNRKKPSLCFAKKDCISGRSSTLIFWQYKQILRPNWSWWHLCSITAKKCNCMLSRWQTHTYEIRKPNTVATFVLSPEGLLMCKDKNIIEIKFLLMYLCILICPTPDHTRWMNCKIAWARILFWGHHKWVIHSQWVLWYSLESMSAYSCFCWNQWSASFWCWWSNERPKHCMWGLSCGKLETWRTTGSGRRRKQLFWMQNLILFC